MKARFINLTTITLSPESQEEMVLFDNFVKQIASNKAELRCAGFGMTMGEPYSNMQITLQEKKTYEAVEE